jgi:hypothetical protein
MRLLRPLGALVVSILALGGCAPPSSPDPSLPDPSPPDPAPRVVRAFAVGNHLDLAAAESYATFDAEMRRVMELVAPDLSAEHDNLVVLAEDIGLPAAFIGSRGALGRQASAADAAFLALAAGYEPVIVAYLDRFPGVSFNRVVTLAIADTMARAFFGTYPALAREYGVYLSACTLLPRVRSSTDPADLALLADPDLPSVAAVWVPEDENVYNVCYVWDPEGREVGVTRKVNLTPVEQALLDLSPAPLAEVEAIELPFGSVGIAISLDAFIPSYVQHLHDQGVEIVLQNDANAQPWVAYQERSDHLGPPPSSEPIWQAEEWEDSTIRMMKVREWPGLRYNVCPMMVGNLFDLAFDGQSSITMRDPAADDPDAPAWKAYVGNPAPHDEFVRLGPWTFPDPAQANPSLDLAARRAILEEQGRRLLPGSGDAMEDGYIESVVWADLELPAR